MVRCFGLCRKYRVQSSRTPKRVLFYLEQHNITDIDQIMTSTVKGYYQELQQRANQRRDGGLSNAYLNKHQQALKKFKEYLQKHGHKGIAIHLKSENNPTQEKTNILTQAEIKELFLATEYSHHHQHFCLRDKAILTILYSCGLRRNEAVHLELKDVLFDKQRIHVRKGKNYKERFVPINSYNLRILEDYIYESRPYYVKDTEDTDALFISAFGKRLQGLSLANRLKVIANATQSKDIIKKQITPHTLRHCIATHLLQQNVPLESIKSFLGHSSLESTQIYTHLLKTLEDETI